jgi:uncharacterized Zn finger protein
LSDWYEPRKRIVAKGGIKSQCNFGKSWWAARWIDALNALGMESRLARGRTYARAGQVLSIDISAGKVNAKVQGSRSTPYNITIGVKTFSEAEWQQAAEALSAQAIFAARLLAGEMPQNIEEVFNGLHLSLLPAATKDITTSCSCPDWGDPCKHVAAVHYILAEEFERDPFMIFRLRGMERDALLAVLAGRQQAADADTEGVEPVCEPLEASADGFWALGPDLDSLCGEARTPPAAAALVRRLGSFPFWRGENPILEELTPSFVAASLAALKVFEG